MTATNLALPQETRALLLAQWAQVGLHRVDVSELDEVQSMVDAPAYGVNRP